MFGHIVDQLVFTYLIYIPNICMLFGNPGSYWESFIRDYVQDYYKTGIITIPGTESIQEIKEACDYLMIPFSEKTIRTNNLSELK